MNYYENNLECIKKYRSYLHEAMKDVILTETTNPVEHIQSVPAKNGEQSIVISVNEKAYRLNSIYNPEDEAKRWALQYRFNKLNNLIAMYGFGNGTFSRAIMDKLGDKGVLLIYEPSAEIFYHTLNNYDITDILSNMSVLITIESINDFEFHNALRALIGLSNIRDMIMCIYPQYDKIFPQSCILFWKELRDDYQSAKININTEIVFGKRLIENTLKNLRYISNISTLTELSKILPMDIPAMIIAAGPSVGRQIEEIKKVKGKAVVFAVDRILEFLLDNGIEPDFIVTLDPVKPVEYFSNRLDIKIPLICFQESNHNILDQHKGKKIISNCSPFLNKIFHDLNKRIPATTSSASVATVAFTVAIELGYRDIILVGQDLAYDGNQTHAGNVEEKPAINLDVYIEDLDGKQIRTRRDWRDFVIWYQDILTLMPELNVIDAKDKGARIKGTTAMPLKEVLDSSLMKEYDLGTILESLQNTFDDNEVSDIVKYLESCQKDLVRIKKKAEEATGYCDQLMKEWEKTLIDIELAKSLNAKLVRINKYITNKSLYSLIDRYVRAATAQEIMEFNDITGNAKEDSVNTYKNSKCIFQAVTEAAEFIKPRLKAAIKYLVSADSTQTI